MRQSCKRRLHDCLLGGGASNDKREAGRRVTLRTFWEKGFFGGAGLPETVVSPRFT